MKNFLFLIFVAPLFCVAQKTYVVKVYDEKGAVIAVQNIPVKADTIKVSEIQYIDTGSTHYIDTCLTTTPPQPTNKPPIANAGANANITLPTNSVVLIGSGTDTDGTIVKYQWTRVSGPTTYTITNGSQPNATVTGLVQGTYIFRLTVTDNSGATATDDMTIIVNPAVTPPPTGYSLFYSDGFDTNNDLDPDQHGQIGNGGLSTSIFVTGPGSFHSRPANVSSGIRSEVQFDDSRTTNEGAVEYDVMYKYVVQNSCHTLQFHPTTSGGSASPGLWTVDGNFTLYNWTSRTGNLRYYSTYKIPTNKWMHIRLEYKFGSSGYLHFFVDGVSVITKDNIQVGDGTSPYLKVGFNGGFDGNTAEAAKSDIYYDNLKIYKKN